jgi:hypothetical protein
MEHIMEKGHWYLDLNFADPDAAKLLLETTAPDGTKVRNLGMLIECSADTGGVFSAILVSFAGGESAHLASNWILSALKRYCKKKVRINKKEFPVTKTGITRFIRDEIETQRSLQAQWEKDHPKSKKRRPSRKKNPN